MSSNARDGDAEALSVSLQWPDDPLVPDQTAGRSRDAEASALLDAFASWLTEDEDQEMSLEALARRQTRIALELVGAIRTMNDTNGRRLTDIRNALRSIHAAQVADGARQSAERDALLTRVLEATDNVITEVAALRKRVPVKSARGGSAIDDATLAALANTVADEVEARAALAAAPATRPRRSSK